MARKYLLLLFTIVVTFVACHRIEDDPLAPPELIEDPYFMNDYMVLGWENIHKGSEGFQGYNVYISTDPSLVDLSGDDSILAANQVRTRIGADSDTVTVHCSELADGTDLYDLDSFFLHIRSVCCDTIGYGETQYQVYPAECQIVQPVENLGYDVVSGQDGNPGGGVRLSWDAPLSAVPPDKYVVSSDWEVLDTVYITEYYIYTPLDEIEVYAVYGREVSRAEEIRFGAVYWIDIELWTVDDPDPSHPNAFGFNDIGEPVTYFIANQDDWPDIDYYLEFGPALASPQNHTPPLNSKNCMVSDEQTSHFGGLDIVSPATKSNYASSQEIHFNQVYGLWLDYKNDGCSSDDHFGKVYVEESYAERVSLYIAYQPIGGLRWVALGGW
ncbi:MAG: hypothetical protein U9Q76_02245 [candidate division WOR-3 bacterium]|nr:hypothetical protein [candidate division WOR-3 bacterium]